MDKSVGAVGTTAPKTFTDQGGKTLEADMPTTEPFVYAAVYFRQLTLKQDDLLTDAADRYCSHTSCVMRQHWIQHEVSQVQRGPESPPWPIPAGQLTLRQLIDAFLYGAGLIHKFRKPGIRTV